MLESEKEMRAVCCGVDPRALRQGRKPMVGVVREESELCTYGKSKKSKERAKKYLR